MHALTTIDTVDTAKDFDPCLSGNRVSDVLLKNSDDKTKYNIIR